LVQLLYSYLKAIMQKAINIVSFVLLYCLLLTMNSCYTNPVTGSRSLALVDEGQMRTLAVQQYSTFLSTNPAIKGTPEAAMVQRVGSRLATAVQQYLSSKGQANLIEGYQWEFNLVNNKEVNAWCMPGGKVVVYSGIIPVVQNEAGLAVVLGHEIGHAIARHGSARMSEQLVAQAGGATLSAALSNKPAQTQNIFNGLYGIGAQGYSLHYSRGQEDEADEMGLYFMAMAGYDPHEAVSFWQRMNSTAKSPEGIMVYLSDHPSNTSRISHINQLMPKAMSYYHPQ